MSPRRVGDSRGRVSVGRSCAISSLCSLGRARCSGQRGLLLRYILGRYVPLSKRGKVRQSRRRADFVKDWSRGLAYRRPTPQSRIASTRARVLVFLLEGPGGTVPTHQEDVPDIAPEHSARPLCGPDHPRRKRLAGNTPGDRFERHIFHERLEVLVGIPNVGKAQVGGHAQCLHTAPRLSIINVRGLLAGIPETPYWVAFRGVRRKQVGSVIFIGQIDSSWAPQGVNVSAMASCNGPRAVVEGLVLSFAPSPGEWHHDQDGGGVAELGQAPGAYRDARAGAEGQAGLLPPSWITRCTTRTVLRRIFRRLCTLLYW